jgi:hypothetical protein
MHTRILIALSIAAGPMNPVAAAIATTEQQQDADPALLALRHRAARPAGALR